MTFGAGIHTCVGAAPARAELRIVLELVLDGRRGCSPTRTGCRPGTCR